MKKVLDTLDHKDINQLEQFKGMSPSSEKLAEYIYNEMKKVVPIVSKVSVWETNTSCATYYED